MKSLTGTPKGQTARTKGIYPLVDPAGKFELSVNEASVVFDAGQSFVPYFDTHQKIYEKSIKHHRINLQSLNKKQIKSLYCSLFLLSYLHSTCVVESLIELTMAFDSQ